MRRSLLLVLATGLAAGRVAVAQAPGDAVPAATPRWRWYVSGSLGLARRQDEPWETIHLALNPANWDPFYPVNSCQFCPQSSEIADGWPLNLTLSVRYRVHGRFQLRGFAASAPLGYYPGGNNGIDLRVKPADRVAGLQGLFAWHGLWMGIGPTLNAAQVDEVTPAVRRRSSGLRAGAAASIGVAVLQRGAMYVEVSLERCLAAAIDVPVLAVPGAPDIPAMRVAVSHTVLGVGIGLRR